MSARRILLTGATGFIGSATLRTLLDGPLACAAHSGSTTLTMLTRNPPAGADPRVDWIRADLTDPRSLHGVCEGVDTVVHLASYVGGDAHTCEAVNNHGTRALIAEAARAGTDHFLYLSTTAVYGAGPHRGLTEDEITPAPVSPTSRTRLAAEAAVRAAGGTVLRAPLVYGIGDVWVVPVITELLRRVPAWVDGGRALLSLVAVDDLARLLATLALTAVDAALPTGVYHAAHPDPVPFSELLTLLARHTGLPLPADDLTYDEYVTRLHQVPGRATERQLSLIAQDHWYASAHVWQQAFCPPGPGPATRIPESAAWYRCRLD
ncbi:NAD-dependent epimerase/dehydratase family protein [Streptomyces sp. NPDC001339]|uniref:NAD-dependent epimerase/dehydratase family protein n=1 Tax=Streptomyces sp. NPDC001339 TaxID=3364563 RepID=UPI0036828BEA